MCGPGGDRLREPAVLVLALLLGTWGASVSSAIEWDADIYLIGYLRGLKEEIQVKHLS